MRRITAEKQKRAATRNMLEERNDRLKIEKSIVKRTKWLITKLPPHLQKAAKASVFFEHLFVSIETNNVKRYNRLKRIFNFRPTYEDKGWLDLMIKQLPIERVKSRTLGLRYGLCKLME